MNIKYALVIVFIALSLIPAYSSASELVQCGCTSEGDVAWDNCPLGYMAQCVINNPCKCVYVGACGNGVKDSGEQCDGTATPGNDCSTLFGSQYKGKAQCSSSCTYTLDGCYIPIPSSSLGTTSAGDWDLSGWMNVYPIPYTDFNKISPIVYNQDSWRLYGTSDAFNPTFGFTSLYDNDIETGRWTFSTWVYYDYSRDSSPKQFPYNHWQYATTDPKDRSINNTVTIPATDIFYLETYELRGSMDDAVSVKVEYLTNPLDLSSLEKVPGYLGTDTDYFDCGISCSVDTARNIDRYISTDYLKNHKGWYKITIDYTDRGDKDILNLHLYGIYASSWGGTNYYAGEPINFNTIFPAMQSSIPESICGNSMMERGEVCDSNVMSCGTQGGYAGTKKCNSACDGWNACTCSSGDYLSNGVCCPIGSSWDGSKCAVQCGNGVCDNTESCNSCYTDCGKCYNYLGKVSNGNYYSADASDVVAKNGAAGVATDSSRNLYVYSNTDCKIRKYAPNGNLITTMFSGCGGNYPSRPTSAYTANSLAIDKSSNIFVTDSANNRVLKYNSNGAFVTSLSNQLSKPTQIAIDSNNNVYVMNTGNTNIVKFSNAGGNALATVSAGFLGYDPAIRAMTIDSNNHIYLYYYTASTAITVLEYDSSLKLVNTYYYNDIFNYLESENILSGMVKIGSHFIGSGDYMGSDTASKLHFFTKDFMSTYDFGFYSGSGTEGSFGAGGVSQMATDSLGDIYVDDPANSRVQHFTNRVVRCGDKVLDPGEQCDNGDQASGGTNDVSCTPSYGSSCSYCTSSCQIVTVTSKCGDNVKQTPPEDCDGYDLGGATCASLMGGAYGGNLQCYASGSANQCKYDKSGCVPTGAVCGDGILGTAYGEECDDHNTVDSDGCSSACKWKDCRLTSLTISPSTGCVGNTCTVGSVLNVAATYSGTHCSLANDLQIDYMSSDGLCSIKYSSGTINGGINKNGLSLSNSGGSISFSYTIPSVPAACLGKTLTSAESMFRTGLPDSAGMIERGLVNSFNPGSVTLGLCGDNVVQSPLEECDGAVTKSCYAIDPKYTSSSYPTCNAKGTANQCKYNTASCVQRVCGDNHTDYDLGEECDNGPKNSNGGACTTSCKWHRCGDGYIATAYGEECDDGNNLNGDGCNANCKLTDCEIKSVSVNPSTGCNGSACGMGDTLHVDVTYKNNCSRADYMQVDFAGNGCAITSTGVDMFGIGGKTVFCSSNCPKSTSFDYTVPSVPDVCAGKSLSTITSAGAYAGAANAYGSIFRNNQNYTGTSGPIILDQCSQFGTVMDYKSTGGAQTTISVIKNGECYPYSCADYDAVNVIIGAYGIGNVGGSGSGTSKPPEVTQPVTSELTLTSGYGVDIYQHGNYTFYECGVTDDVCPDDFGSFGSCGTAYGICAINGIADEDCSKQTLMKCGNVSAFGNPLNATCNVPVPTPHKGCSDPTDCVYANESTGANATCYGFNANRTNAKGQAISCQTENTWCPVNFIFDSYTNSCVENFDVCAFGNVGAVSLSCDKVFTSVTAYGVTKWYINNLSLASCSRNHTYMATTDGVKVPYPNGPIKNYYQLCTLSQQWDYFQIYQWSDVDIYYALTPYGGLYGHSATQ